MSECCDDEDDAGHDDDYWDDEDDSYVKEEPDCFSCNDSGCPACEPHPNGCDCAHCFESIVHAYEIFDDPDRELVPAFVDEPPF